MKVDLGKPHKMIGGLIVLLETNEVYLSNGKCLGVLPKGKAPSTSDEIAELLKPSKPVEEETEEEAPKKLSMKTFHMASEKKVVEKPAATKSKVTKKKKR